MIRINIESSYNDISHTHALRFRITDNMYEEPSSVTLSNIQYVGRMFKALHPKIDIEQVIVQSKRYFHEYGYEVNITLIIPNEYAITIRDLIIEFLQVLRSFISVPDEYDIVNNVFCQGVEWNTYKKSL